MIDVEKSNIRHASTEDSLWFTDVDMFKTTRYDMS
jgi:hypothetical protein